MNMPMVYYTQNCVIGFAVLMIVYLNFRRIFDRRQFSHVMFVGMMAAVAFSLTAEYAFYMLNGRPGAASGAALRAVLALLFALEPVPEALWVGYVFGVVHGEDRPTRVHAQAMLLPAAVNFVFTIFSIPGGQLFSVNDQNVFRRGPLYLVTPALCYSYLLFYLYYAFRKRRAMLRREFLSIFLAMLPMALAGGVQVLIPGIYLTWLAAAFSILILYIGIIVNQANTDHLTGLANRRRFDGRLQSALRQDGAGAPVALVLVDIDDFKDINDRYGHLTGDRALEAVGAALRRSARKGDLVARIGGDEFALVAAVHLPEDVNRIAGRIRESIAALNQRRDFPFSIEASVGAGMCTELERMTPDALIDLVDNRMYGEKRRNQRRDCQGMRSLDY